MFWLLFLCAVAVDTRAIDGDLLTEWDSASPFNNDRIQPVELEDRPPYSNEDHALHGLENKHDLIGENIWKYAKDDIQLGFDEEATELIKKLTKSLRILNKNIVKTGRATPKRPKSEVYIVKVAKRHSRNKRNADKIKDGYNNTPTAVAEVNNETVTNNATNTDGTDLTPERVRCNETHTRRSFSEDLEVSNAVKARLLSYIKEHFNDIENKINSLRNVKQAFASDNEYNIGYMVANIDMLEVNLRNLKEEMERNRHELGEKHVLDMFDKVKVSNSLVTRLIRALKFILERKAAKTAVPPPDRF